jgi:hypothetical protein
MFLYFRALLVIALALPLLAQQPTASTAKKTAKETTAASKHLTVEDVIAMTGAGISDDVIIARLRKEDKALDLSAEDLIRLKKCKVSDAVLKVMMDPRTSPAAAAPQQQTSQPVMLQTPLLAGVPTVTRSGATPGPGASTAGDLNDPLVPHDSGIYLFTKNQEGAPQMTVLERAAYQGSKTGGMLASAMTYGIKKTKTKAVIPGPRASVRVTDPLPVFYFYFDDKQAGLGKTYFGIGSLSNPSQFVLLKLEVKRSDRETIIGQYSALGMSSGSDANAMVPFKSERIRPGLYKVTVDGMKEGEYCFLASSGMASTGMAAAYGIGTTGTADIFDFGVSIN